VSDWAIGGGGGFDADARVTASSTMITIADGGSDDALGSWVQMIAATSIQAEMLLVQLGTQTAAGTSLIDIGVGTAGNEEVIVPNLQWSVKSGLDAANSFLVPIRIPQGVRVAMRMRQDGAQPSTTQVGLTLLGQGFAGIRGFGSADSIGAQTTGSTGTSCDPGTTINTKVITQLIASTAQNYKAFLVGIHTDGNVGISPGNEALIDINVGASSSEEVIIPDLSHRITTSEGNLSAFYGPFFIEVAASQRLSASVQCSQNTAGDRLRFISLIGFF